MTDVIANPAAMQDFVTGMTTAHGTLADAKTTEAATVFAFLGEGSTGITGGYEIVGQAMTALLKELIEVKDWVKIVRDAAIEADVGKNGDTTVSADALNAALRRIAAERGVDLNALAASNIVTPPVTTVTPTPPDSGFVNDPVCTATGHLLIDATDFAMPARLAVLTFRRLYASQDMVDGAFGPGWWSWADARGGINAAGELELVGPDARHATFAPDGGGGFETPPHLDLVATIEGDTQRLRWGRRSPYFGQTWVFEGGFLREVVGPFVGSTTFHYDAGSRLVRLVHDSGRAVELAWRGRTVIGLRSDDGRRVRFRYDRRGHLVAVDNAVSPETYEVDEQGRILAITDADGVRMVAMTYDLDGRVVAQISQTGLTTRFGYTTGYRTTLSDASHRPISVYTHDEQGRVEMYATAGGLRFSRRFDEYGRVVEQHEPDGTSVTMAEHTEGERRIEELTSSSGQVERFEFDRLDRLVRHTAAQGATTAAGTSFEYHGDTLYPSRLAVDGELGLAVELAWEHGLPSRMADSDGVVDEFEVAADGTLASYRNGLGDVTRFEYSPSGALSARYLPDGRVVGYDRDDAGRLLAMVNPAGERGELLYTPAGRLLSTRDHDGAVITLEYDGAGLPHRVVAPDGAATDFVFDDEQRVVGVRFANGDTVGFERDEFGRETAVDVDDSRWTIDRDQAGRVVKLTDPDGVAAEAEHDPLGQWMSITDSTGERWQLERGLIDRVRRLRTPTGVDEAAYTAEGLLASTSSLDGGKQQDIRYTKAGRIASIAEGGQWIEYRYDDAGRMTGVNGGTGWWHFEHDSNGRMVRRVSPAGREQRYGYDVRGNPASITVGGDTWSFGHDARGRLRTLTDPTGRASTFTYDHRGRMTASSDAGGVALRYDYDGRGRVAQLVDAAGGAVSYTYNPFHQLTSITDQLGRSVNAEYDRSGRHRRTSYVDPRPDRPIVPQLAELGDDLPADVHALSTGQGVARRAETPDGLVTTWTLVSGTTVELERDADGFAALLTSPGFLRRWVHDDCGRILAVTDELDGTVHVTTLERDGAGRIVRQDVDGEVTEFAYGPAGELVARSGAGGEARWEYDRLGRLSRERTPDTTRQFRYDAAHQLVELVETPADGQPLVTTFEYDGRGRRVRASGASDVVYVWGDRSLDALVVDGEVRRYRCDPSGRLEAAGGTAVRWDEDSGAYQPSAIGEDAIVTVDATTAGTVDGRGQVTWRPFTVADAWGGGSADGTRWHEYYGVEADGLVWLGSRPYDPGTRQFLAPDPLTPKPGKAGGPSPYTYAANDPINLFDPSGNAPISIEAFNDMRDRKTGPQWQNIAVIAIAVVAVVATVATAGAFGPVGTILIGAAIGAASGAASGAAREGLEAGLHLGDGEFNGETIIKDTLTGAAGGALGAGVGVGFSAMARGASATMPSLTRAITSRGGSIVEEAVGGFGEGVLGETYDVTLPKDWGADGAWNNDAIAQNTVISAGAGGTLHNVHFPGQGGASPTGGVDPSTTGIDSPAPGHSSVPGGGHPDTTAPDTSHGPSGSHTNPDSRTPSESNTGSQPESNAPASNAAEPSAPDPDAPDTNAPESNAPDTNAPDTNAPDTNAPDTNAPDTNAPDTNAAESNAPESNVPESNVPESNAPDTNVPESNAPESNVPESNAPDTNVPETNAPDTNAPESNAPETNAPESNAPDTNVPESNVPESNAPDTNAPESNAPDTNVPESNVPESNAPDTNVPESNVPESNAPDTNAPESNAPDTNAPDTNVPDTNAPDTNVPESNAPDTNAPESNAPDTNAPDTNAPDTNAPDTNASHTNAPDSNAPDTNAPDTNALETSAPDQDAPESNAPDSNAPDTNAPDTNAPETSAPDQNAPESNAPDQSVPESSAPDQRSPDQSAPDQSAPDHNAPDSDAATAVTAAAAATSVNAPSLDTPGGSQPPLAPRPPDAADGAPPPKVRRFVTVETVEPIVTRTHQGILRPRHITTVDADTLPPTGTGKVLLPDGRTVTVRAVRNNEMTVTYDSNDVPMHFRARITERYPNISRLRSGPEGRAQTATAADGDTGALHDSAPDQSYDGGHAGGHQFFPDLGRNNMFPQESGFNQGAYKNLESEVAAWAKEGARVDMEVVLKVTRHGGVTPTQSKIIAGRPVQQVPDRVTVRMRYSDAHGNTIRSYRKRFLNVDGQSYQAQRPTAAQLARLPGSANDR